MSIAFDLSMRSILATLLIYTLDGDSASRSKYAAVKVTSTWQEGPNMKPRRLRVGRVVLCLLAVAAAPWVCASAGTGVLTVHFINVGQGGSC